MSVLEQGSLGFDNFRLTSLAWMHFESNKFSAFVLKGLDVVSVQAGRSGTGVNFDFDIPNPELRQRDKLTPSNR